MYVYSLYSVARCIYEVRIVFYVNFCLLFTGISNFDLLGAFGRQTWLANFNLILLYNVVFGFAATTCLVNKFSASMRQAIYKKMVQAFTGEAYAPSPAMSDSRYFD